MGVEIIRIKAVLSSTGLSLAKNEIAEVEIESKSESEAQLPDLGLELVE